MRRMKKSTMYEQSWVPNAYLRWWGGEGEEDSKGCEVGAVTGTVGGIRVFCHHLTALLRPATTGEQGQTSCQ